jgi:ADP-ribose pyrophosphatase
MTGCSFFYKERTDMTEEERQKEMNLPDDIRHAVREDRKLVYKGSILDVYSDSMLLTDGGHEKWDFVSHRKGAAAVLAVREDGQIVMVRQYRPALNRWTLEIPAGSRDSVNEDTKITAMRELREETGYICKSVKPLLQLKSTVAFCDEFIDVYLADGLSERQEQILDEAENIFIENWDLDALIDKIRRGAIQDSKTVAAVLAYALARR